MYIAKYEKGNCVRELWLPDKKKSQIITTFDRLYTKVILFITTCITLKINCCFNYFIFTEYMVTFPSYIFSQ